MARCKEFDREAVLEKAMALFWRQGYEATSVQDLVDHMGINRGSLYDTFGDKHALFLAAIDHYRSVVVARRLAVLDAPGSPKQAIRRFFEEAIRFAVEEGCSMGCLITNSAVELTSHDPQTAARVTANLAAMEAAFYRALSRARAAGEIGKEKDLRALARFLTGSLQGLRVIAKTVPDRTVLEDIVEVTLNALD